jgi:hypothetical protein
MTNTPMGAADFRFAYAQPALGYLCAIDGPAIAPLSATPRLYTTTDGGKRWQLVSGAPVIHPVPVGDVSPLVTCRVFLDANDPAGVFLQEVELEPQGAGYAIARALFRSQNAGATWEQLGTIARTDGFDALAVLKTRLIARIHPSIYGTRPCDPAERPAAYSYLYASDDKGATWHQIGQNIERQGYSPSEFAYIPQGHFLLAGANAVPASACAQRPGKSAFWRSEDGGTTWQQTMAQAGYVAQLSLALGGGGYCGVAVVWSFDAANLGRKAVLFWGGGPVWKQLPAPPGVDPQYVDYFPVGVTPSCTVIAQVNPFADPRAGIFAMRPADASPTWTYIADGRSRSWQIVRGQSFTLWAFDTSQPGPSGSSIGPLKSVAVP